MQTQKTDMGKRQFRIGDLARELHVKKFVIRFWEREFDLKSDRSQGGQRFYTDDDLKTFQVIKHLLYEQGFTIAGAKKQLEPVISGESPLTTIPTYQETIVRTQAGEANIGPELHTQAAELTIVPAITPQKPIENVNRYDEAAANARVKEEVMQTLAPIKAKLEQLKAMLK